MGSISDEINQLLAQPDQGTQPAAPAAPSGGITDEINSYLSGNPPPPPDAKPEPSLWRNTVTAVGRGLGGLMEGAGQGEMLQDGIPDAARPAPGDIAKATTNMVTGGQPYQAQTWPGRVYQNALAGTIEGAPMAALGPGGVPAFLTRQAMNLTGNVGGELGREATPSHPIVGGLIGSTVGSLATPTIFGLLSGLTNQAKRLLGTSGAVDQQAMKQFVQQPNIKMPETEVDQTLSQNSPYWTQGRLDSAPEWQKRQAVNKYLPQAPAAATAPSPMQNVKDTLTSATLGGITGSSIAAGVAHLLGLPHGYTELIGNGVGEIGGMMLKPYMQSRNAIFNQNVQNRLGNQSGMWQQYQANPPVPLWQQLMMGAVAPDVSTQAAP